MPLVETLPVGDGCAQWDVWGTVARIVVTDPAKLPAATELVRAELAAVDAACSRFRPDSELVRACAASGRPIRISPLLAELITVALSAAEATDGDVDPTLGSSLAALGYDRDFAALAGRVDAAGEILVRPTVDWRRIALDGTRLTVPAGTLIDLGATAKAWAADRCAEIVARQCGIGALVALGGDIATAGSAPDGWDILVQDGTGEPACTVTLPAGCAIATSSTISRNWQRATRTMHHILDPRTGYPAIPIWRTATAVAYRCVDANTVTTAAVVRGPRTPAWLRQLGVAARLVAADGSVVTFGGWSSP